MLLVRHGLRNFTNLEENFLYVIDDSQDNQVGQKITVWLESLPFAELIQPVGHLGFYQGICKVMDQGGQADYCVLRENVVVTPNWLEHIKETAYSSDTIGIVSPVTPRHPFYELSLKPGDNILTCSEKLSLLAVNEYPRLPVPDPNILYIKRAALKKVPFPRNVDDETEKPLIRYVVDLLKKGSVCALAESVFVYVSPKKKHTAVFSREKVLEQINIEEDRYIFKKVVELFDGQRLSALAGYKESDIKIVKKDNVAILFSSIILRGGILILTELVNDLILDGINVKSFLLNANRRHTECFDNLFEPFPFAKVEDIVSQLPRYASVFATFWNTVPIVEEIVKRNPTIQGYYFMQDFEVLFYDPHNLADRKYYEGAGNSYRTSLHKIATSDWIIQKVRDFLGDEIHPIQKINVGINLELFYPRGEDGKRTDKLRILAMARPETPRRGFDDLVGSFIILARERSDLEFVFFGSNDLSSHEIPFEYKNLGCLPPEQLPIEYSKADIVVDASHFQGFGLVPLEAMACGCACILTDSGGVREYAQNGVNAILIPPRNKKAIAAAIAELVDNEVERKRIGREAVRTAAEFSHHNLAGHLLELLNNKTGIITREIQVKSSNSKCTIVIPVYNEIAAVRACLESVSQFTDHPFEAIVVDDCSDKYSAWYLQNFASQHQNFRYVRNPKNIGFVGSVNRGMEESEHGDIVLLNSDTIVTPGWLSKLYKCAHSDEKIGIVSPLSTRSSHLWLKLNPGDSIFDASEKINEISAHDYPDIVTPEGWCFYIKRELYELLGGFDAIFGRGYCEESDYSMQAYANGYRLVCCDDVFIYHEGMVTFKEERGERYSSNRRIFDQRWKPLYEKIYEDFLTRDPLRQLRVKYQRKTTKGYICHEDAVKKEIPEVIDILNDKDALAAINYYENQAVKNRITLDEGRPKIVFVLSVLQPYGGVLSVVQLVNDLLLQGEDVEVVVLSPKGYEDELGLLTRPVFFSDMNSMIQHFPKNCLIIGTLWITMYYVAMLAARDPASVSGYFVQDFEPLFYSDDDKTMKEAILRTYKWAQCSFAKTPWIVDQVRDVGGEIVLVPPALDLELFYPRDIVKDESKKIIFTMFRPSTPQRGFEVAVEVFAGLARKRDDIEIHTFGCSSKELEKYAIPFQYVNHGVVPNSQLPELYSRAHVFAEFSHFHGFGRTVAEAMACETACVVTASGGVEMFALDAVNCLMAAPGDINGLKAKLERVLNDDSLRIQIGKAGREAVKRFDRKKSARETIHFLTKCSVANEIVG